MHITDSFIIGHIPKTGGHILSVMLKELNIKVYNSPYKIKDKTAHSTDTYKHKTFNEVNTEGKDILLVIRRLPAWFFSIMWHNSVHYKLNEKHRFKKSGVGKTYDTYFKDKKPKFSPPKLMCYTTYPDMILKQNLAGYDPDKIIWLRMEYLEHDLLKYLNIKQDLGVDFRHSYTAYNKYLRWYNYWNPKSKVILHKQNPLWTSIQQKVYKKEKI